MKTLVNAILSIMAIATLGACAYIIKVKVVEFNGVRLSSYKVGYMHGYYDNTPDKLKNIVCGQYWTFYHEQAIRKLNYRLENDRTEELDVVVDFDFELKYRSKE